ncbi:MAG: hypothetical protein ACI4TR_02175 [Bacteroidaceae bacterium]
MKQEEIVNEIRKKCGDVELMPSMGWYFIYNGRHYFYLKGKDDGMIRFCVPHLVKAEDYDKELLAYSINETNRNVKFIKAVRLECGSVSLNYDHKTTENEPVGKIVPHIINALDFASTYLLDKLNKNLDISVAQSKLIH